jgi:molybdopterin-containing oxidoreductase family iron-sulfur binding subunit
MVACPYGARYFNWFEPAYADGHGQHQNPEIVRDAGGWLIGPSPRPRGVVEKCTLCVQRIERAKEEGKPIGSDTPGGVVSACAQTCPAFAIAYGDLDEPTSEVARRAKDKRAFRLLEDLGTRPQVYYLSEV